jgi:hypothetical protein
LLPTLATNIDAWFIIHYLSADIYCLALNQGSPYDILFASFPLQGPELDLCLLPSLDYQKIERAGIVTVLDQGHPLR